MELIDRVNITDANVTDKELHRCLELYLASPERVAESGLINVQFTKKFYKYAFKEVSLEQFKAVILPNIIKNFFNTEGFDLKVIDRLVGTNLGDISTVNKKFDDSFDYAISLIKNNEVWLASVKCSPVNNYTTWMVLTRDRVDQALRNLCRGVIEPNLNNCNTSFFDLAIKDLIPISQAARLMLPECCNVENLIRYISVIDYCETLFSDLPLLDEDPRVFDTLFLEIGRLPIYEAIKSFEFDDKLYCEDFVLNEMAPRYQIGLFESSKNRLISCVLLDDAKNGIIHLDTPNRRQYCSMLDDLSVLIGKDALVDLITYQDTISDFDLTSTIGRAKFSDLDDLAVALIIYAIHNDRKFDEKMVDFFDLSKYIESIKLCLVLENAIDGIRGHQLDTIKNQDGANFLYEGLSL